MPEPSSNGLTGPASAVDSVVAADSVEAATTVRDFLVPDLGEGLDDATLVAWSVEVGDVVALNQTLCVLETAKAEVEIPSPFSGRVAERSGEPGDTLDVGATLARIEVHEPVMPPSSVQATGGPDGSETVGSETVGSGSGAVLVGYGTSTGSTRRRARRGSDAESHVTRPADPTGAPSAPPGVARARAKPKTRRLARELGLDLQALAPGSGPAGAVTRDDVRAAAGDPVIDALAAPPPRTSRDTASNGERDEKIDVVGVRARIAERLTVAHRSIPSASASVEEVDCSRLLEVKAILAHDAQRVGEQPVVTPFSLILYLVVVAAGRHRTLNASYDEAEHTITRFGDVHLGVATATERGLVVPVVRRAGSRSVLDLSAEVRRLATAARDGTLAPAEMVGSTITVSNFGALGLDSGAPMINAPEAAIVGVGAIRQRAVVVEGEIVARPTVTISCTFDHRVADGAEVGAFLSTLRSLIEEPTRAL